MAKKRPKDEPDEPKWTFHMGGEPSADQASALAALLLEAERLDRQGRDDVKNLTPDAGES